MIKQVSAPFSINNPTATTKLMLILKGKNSDGADWLRLVNASTRKQQKFHLSFYKPGRHRQGGIETWLSRDYFTIKKGKAKSHA